MIAVPSRQPDGRPPPRARGRPRTVSIHLAVSALVLTTILLTAAASSLLWWRTAEATSRQLASTINEQIVAAVRKEVSAIVGEARAAHTAIRTLFLQNVLDAREADKREFVFLSQLQSQATISWVAFGWPDGSFFAAHKLGDGHLEMMEISLTDHPGRRRIDDYAVIQVRHGPPLLRRLRHLSAPPAFPEMPFGFRYHRQPLWRFGVSGARLAKASGDA
jgi:adenylate cyclase